MNNELIKILHLEDNISDAELIHIVLANMFTSLEYYHVQYKDEFINALKNKVYNLILIDYNVPSIIGIEALKIALKHQQNTPVIFVSGTIEINESLDILRAGATDYVMKSNLKKLPLSINRVLLEEQEKRNRKIAEEKIITSELKFKKLSNLTFEGILIHEKGIINDVNFSFTKMFGFSREELLGNNIIDLIIPKKYHKIISKSITKNYTQPFEIEGIKKDGSIFPIEIEARIIESKINKTFRVAAIRDITERKTAEAENKKLSTVVEQSANFIVITDIEGRIEYVNPSFTKFTGYTLDELLGKTSAILSSSTHTKKLWNRIWQTIKAGKTWKGEINNKTKKGDSYVSKTTITPIKNDDGKIVKISSIGEDITRQKEVEMELLKEKEKVEKNDERHSLVVTASNLGIWDWDLITNDVYLSKVWKSQIGYNENELANSFDTWKEHLHPDEYDEKNLVIENFIKNPIGQYNSEFRFRHKNGSYRWIYVRAETITNENGKVVRMIGSHTDITDLKKAKEKLQVKNKELIKSKEKAEESNQLKTEFLNNMSHEIRTPMNGILGFLDLLKDQNISTKKRQTYINIIENSGKQLLTIIEDILEISRLETKQVVLNEEEFNLNDMLLELFSIFNKNKNNNLISLYLQKGLSNKKSVILTDKTKLGKVLSNLLENAFKFTNTTGHIYFGYKLINKRIEFFVRDTGIGIQKSKINIIFERFSQADKELSKKVGGLGLGLSIAKENVELLGGSISVESKINKGTTFKFDIEYKSNGSNNEMDSEVINEKIEYTHTILIAEDEEINFLILEILFIEKLKLNCTVLHAINGQEAVEMCKNNATIDIVLMDLKMPVMNGFEATRIIREFRPDLPIIAQTAYSTPEDKQTAIEAGCNDFLSKPINTEMLKNLVKTFLPKHKLQ